MKLEDIHPTPYLNVLHNYGAGHAVSPPKLAAAVKAAMVANPSAVYTGTMYRFYRFNLNVLKSQPTIEQVVAMCKRSLQTRPTFQSWSRSKDGVQHFAWSQLDQTFKEQRGMFGIVMQQRSTGLNMNKAIKSSHGLTAEDEVLALTVNPTLYGFAMPPNGTIREPASFEQLLSMASVQRRPR